MKDSRRMTSGSTRRSFLGHVSTALLVGCHAGQKERTEADSAGAVRGKPGEDMAGAELLREVERSVGGRLGACCVRADGTVLLEHRAAERFAMCSTFKAPLAAAILAAAADGSGRPMQATVSLKETDLLSYAPAVAAALEDGEMSLEQLCAAAVQLSDNSAANLLLAELGGPAALTASFRQHGDSTSRLDRIEPDLNENLPGDARDTTTPRAFADLLARLLYGSGRNASAPLRRWMLGSKTGARRLRAGVPADWRVGNKTGTSIGDHPIVCDTGFLESSAGAELTIAVFCDHPERDRTATEAAIAEVARIAVQASGSRV